MGKVKKHMARGPYEAFFKRPLDFVLAAFSMIILSPLILLLALAVRLKIGSPVLFSQERPGRIDPESGKEKIFRLYKFRTMTNERDEKGELLPDEVRLTGFGKKLRASSLDELPELYNILKGDMSFVGPRPLMVQYLPLYNEEQRKRHDVRPGLTGLAQVKGRNAISWQERFRYDTDYVKDIRLKGDMKILAETVKTVLCREGISSATSETMEDFRGNEE